MMKSHLQKAQHNETFLSEVEKLMPDDYFDWKITIVFYIAIHYLDAYFASHGIKIKNHEHRRDKMDDMYTGVSLDCAGHYDNLYNITRNARYDGFIDAEAYRKNQQSKLKEAKRNLKVIRDYIKNDLDQIQGS